MFSTVSSTRDSPSPATFASRSPRASSSRSAFVSLSAPSTRRRRSGSTAGSTIVISPPGHATAFPTTSGSRSRISSRRLPSSRRHAPRSRRCDGGGAAEPRKTQAVGVEMTIARNPLHRSGRAALPHPAPASGNDAKSPQGIGVTNARRGQPPLDEPAHPLPGDVPCVTAPREGAVPEPADLEPEHSDRRAVHGHPVVASVPTYNLAQPCAHHWNRIVQSPPQLGLHLTELRLPPLPDRLPHHREPSIPLLPADVREAEEVERLRLPLAGAPTVLGRERPEFHQPRLLGVQLQTELREPLTQISQKPLGLRPVLEPHDEVVRVPHDDHVAVDVRLPPPLSPEVERIVQVHVGQERRDAAPLGRAFFTPCPRPVLQHAGVEPLLDQPHDAPVRNPVLDELHQPLVVHGLEKPTDVGIEHPVHLPRQNA